MADDRFDLAGAQHGIDLGDLFPELVSVAFDQAARDDQPTRAARAFVLSGFENCVDRFLLGRFDEAACVYNQRLGLFRSLCEFVPASLQEAHHDLAIHEVLGASEADEADLHDDRTELR